MYAVEVYRTHFTLEDMIDSYRPSAASIDRLTEGCQCGRYYYKIVCKFSGMIITKWVFYRQKFNCDIEFLFKFRFNHEKRGRRCFQYYGRLDNGYLTVIKFAATGRELRLFLKEPSISINKSRFPFTELVESLEKRRRPFDKKIETIRI